MIKKIRCIDTRGAGILYFCQKLTTMKSIHYLFLLLAVSLFAACDARETQKEEEAPKVSTDDAKTRTLASDMYLNCWFNEHTLQKNIFRSKPMASKLDSAWTDSYGLRAYIRDIAEDLPKFVGVSFWTYWRKPGVDAKLVVALDSLGANKFWTAVDLKDSVQSANQWQQIRCKLTLPTKIHRDDRVTIYVWNVSKTEMYVDDLEVRFLY